MRLVGLTGGIASGKSTGTAFLASKDYPCIDTDDLAREIVEPGQPALAELVSRFGRSIVSSSGSLDRRALGQIVFADATAREELEAILHPKIRARWICRSDELRRTGLSTCFVAIPLLFETAAESLFEFVICFACSGPSQLERMRARGWSDSHSAQRLASQWPVQSKILRSQFLVWTDVPIPAHHDQLRKILETSHLSPGRGQ